MAFPVFFSSYRRLASLPILLQRFFIIGISIFGPLAQRVIFYKKTAAGTPAAVDGSLFYLQSGPGAQRPTSERRSSLLCSSAQVMLQALVNSSSLRPLKSSTRRVSLVRFSALGSQSSFSIHRIKLYGRFCMRISTLYSFLGGTPAPRTAVRPPRRR